MTPSERKTVFESADAHLALALATLEELLKDGSQNGRDFILANDTRLALERQRTRLARRISTGRHA